MTTNADGQTVTTIVTTESVLSAGFVVTSAASNRNTVNSSGSSSKSNIGEIIGGVLGGVAGLAIILAVLFFVFKKQKRRRELEEAFDGNFDPDRIVRAGGGVGGVRDSYTDTSETSGYGYGYAGGEKAKRALGTEKATSGGAGETTLPHILMGGQGCLGMFEGEERRGVGVGHGYGSGPGPKLQQLVHLYLYLNPSSWNNLLNEEGMDNGPAPERQSTPTPTLTTPSFNPKLRIIVEWENAPFPLVEAIHLTNAIFRVITVSLFVRSIFEL
ncbi:hypothetical protein GYMLUDRAFT_830850 [Collybiopsis luxurians FD-317 M1]|uniref:Uncharacterized protein n=1 Tax=Collybiopsis luxurians FD-317 M1 TaxID=944289 RepID=A0A0D0CD18_9AGAR|nr:hypothetical protein GYMLUDRAFT_830850 [Collybiopsis luxurians FD-317 M1]